MKTYTILIASSIVILLLGAITIVLYTMSTRLDKPTYVFKGGENTEIMNTKTGQIYFYDVDKGSYLYFNNKGEEVYIKSLPILR